MYSGYTYRDKAYVQAASALRIERELYFMSALHFRPAEETTAQWWRYQEALQKVRAEEDRVLRERCAVQSLAA